jgi:hypothetical protein
MDSASALHSRGRPGCHPYLGLELAAGILEPSGGGDGSIEESANPTSVIRRPPCAGARDGRSS